MFKLFPALALVAMPATAQTYLCGGVEPFWSLELSQSQAHFSTPSEQGTPLEVALVTKAEGRPWPKGFTLVSEATTGVAILHQRSCNDTMSDTRFDYSLDYLTQSGLTPVIYTGCCRLKP